ncbi:MAG: hypothetical protein HeimC3_31110 [Candidatus Heimdallarchaeota archaeon LC_3]|nr:MAG: hypothetical protein HeimC3_31110 [Candidatus Heimdallarchaeota archaeon LC_3]
MISDVQNSYKSWQTYIKNDDDEVRSQNIFFRLIDKIRPYFLLSGWYFVIFLLLSTFILGFIGFNDYLANKSISNIIYNILRLFILEGDFTDPIPIHLEIARFLGPLLLAYAGIIAGLTFFHEAIQNFQLKFIKNHVIICGLGEKGEFLALDFLKSNFKVVIIEKDRENSNIIQFKKKNTIIIIADASEKAVLQKIRIDYAKYVIAVCGDDGVNIEIAVHGYNIINNIIEEKIGKTPIDLEKKVKCYVHLVNPNLKKILKKHIIFTNPHDIFDLVFFNSYENAARILFRNFPVDQLTVINPSFESVHIVVIGLGQMGRNIVLQAAKICHYASKMRASITVVDKIANQKVESFIHEYPSIEKILNFYYEQVDVISPDLQNAKFWESKSEISLFIVCLDDDVLSLSTGLSLLNRMGDKRKPVLVRMKENSGLATLLNEPDFLEENPLYPFGMTKEIISRDIIINESLDSLARIINNLWIIDHIGGGESTELEPPPTWSSLNEEYKESNRQQADHIDVKLRSIDCQVNFVSGRPVILFEYSNEEIEELAHLEHKRWMADKLLNGWSYAEERNKDRKTNPNLVLWEKLSEEVKNQNRGIIRNIPKLLSKYNLEIQKVDKKKEDS